MTDQSEIDQADAAQRSRQAPGATNVARSAVPNMIGDSFSAGGSRLNVDIPVTIQLGDSTDPLSIFSGGGGSPGSADGYVPLNVLVGGQVMDMAEVQSRRTEYGILPGVGAIPANVSGSVLLDPSVGSVAVPVGTQLATQELSAGSGYNVAADEALIRSELAPYGYDFSYQFLPDSNVLVTSAGVDSNNDGDFLDLGDTPPQGVANMNYSVNLIGPDIILPNPGAGGTVGRLKIAENTSPLPRDRLIFDYNLFHNVPLYVDFPVNRFTPGFEKTLFDGMASVEMRFPMAITLPQSVDLQSGLDYTSFYEFGNMSVTPKVLLMQRQNFALSMGMSIFLPTAQDLKVTWYDGTDIIHIDNKSVNLAPFVGGLWTPNDRTYFEAFLQYSVDTNGCPVTVDLFTPNPVSLGRIYDGTNQYLDIAGGMWLWENPDRCGNTRRIAWQNELHWNYSLRAPTIAHARNFTIGQPNANMDQWNFTTALVAQMQNDLSVSFAFATPLTSSRDFDGEFHISINRFFGPR